jgi:methylenetetrahydrofolate dehydrogenase (NADP+)/methenyltetrahydrofolate cyclohydrolase
MEINLNNKIISGTRLSNIIQNLLKDKIDFLKTKFPNLSPPKLVIIQLGNNYDSSIYFKNIHKRCKEIGIESESIFFEYHVSNEELIERIEKLNKDENINGIIIQRPFPKHLEKSEIEAKIDLRKDVDGLFTANFDNFLDTANVLISPTTMAVVELLRLAVEFNNNLNKYTNEYIIRNIFNNKSINLEGKNVAVFGRGSAGLPLYLLMKKCNAIITLCHSETEDVNEKCLLADIVISAVGKKNLIKSDMIKRDCIVIDVGINITDKGICGDVDFDNVIGKSKYITPVPGGVGKMTVVLLLRNVIMSWSTMNKIDI